LSFVDAAGTVITKQRIQQPQIGRTKTTISFVVQALDVPRSISRARLAMSLLVTFVFSLILFLLSHQHVREYLGKSNSPPRFLLYLVGLGALTMPELEKSYFVASSIGEIAEAEGWERIRYTIDLLRVGPRVYLGALLAHFAERLKISK
jgi:hypothetical protein